MEAPKIVKKESFTVVGMKYHGQALKNEIPQLWQTFMGRMGEVKNIVGCGNSFGVSLNFDEQSKEFDYIAAYEVSPAEDVPADLVTLEIPSAEYAVFICTLPTIKQVYEHIYGVWMPQSGHQRAAGPEFEFYDEKFDPSNPASEMSVYIPIS